MSSVTKSLGFGGGSSSNDGSKAAKIAADYENRSLDYLMEREELPQQFREGALTQQAGMLGLEGGEGSQQDLIDRARLSPLYGAIMGGQEAGEEAILRNASMTGGLRSGNVQDAMYRYNTELENQALLTSYQDEQQGLRGMAGLPSMAPIIAQQQSGIGQTLAQGKIADAQSGQASQQQGMGNLMGLGQLGVSSGLFSKIGGMFSGGA